MQNYISVAGKQVELSQEQADKILEGLGVKIHRRTLAECKPGEIVNVGGFEMVVLEQKDGETSLILKDFWVKESRFGEGNNRYDGSIVDSHCADFEKKLSETIGLDNIIPHEVDLTSNDGLKCYGSVDRRVSLLTAARYRKYVDVLDTVKPENWWWLATPWSTKRHDNEAWVLCVAPSGLIDGDYFGNIDIGVRPFCILKSSIVVSG